MKVSLYEQFVRTGATRRDVLKGAASVQPRSRLRRPARSAR